MKRILLAISITFLSMCVYGQTPVAKNGKLSVDGTQIVNQQEESVSLAGPSLFWSNTGWGGEDYYKSAVVEWVASDWDANIIRAAMGVEDDGGYITDSASNIKRVKTVVDAAIDAGIYVIIDWHSHNAEDYEDEAIEFFEEMATLYGNTDNVIYEIYNEPLRTTSWENDIKPYAEKVIKAIRDIDSDNLIIVGTSSWSQDVDEASEDPITGYSNIAYTLHFYSGTHSQYLRNKAQTALNNGVALMVTEWGAVDADGDGDVDEDETELWMDFLCENKISHCNWALNDKDEGASALKSGASTSGNWADSDLTTSGVYVKDIIENWNADCNSGLVNVNDEREDFELELYPNPVKSDLFISVGNDVEVLNFKLYDVLGTNILEAQNPSNKIALNNVKPGVYTSEIVTNKGVTTKQLIVE